MNTNRTTIKVEVDIDPSALGTENNPVLTLTHAGYKIRRTRATHRLKSMPQFFATLDRGVDIRYDDRRYEIGDRIIFMECDAAGYSGKYIHAKIDDLIYCAPGVLDQHVMICYSLTSHYERVTPEDLDGLD